MNKLMKTLLFCLGVISCKTEQPSVENRLEEVRARLVDRKATAETAAMWENLRQLSREQIAFGHQDDTRNGYGWINDFQHQQVSRLRSDVQELTGKYPAVYGWDFMRIAGFYTGMMIDYERTIHRSLVLDAYQRGGVNTFSWHYYNPITKLSQNWRDSPVEVVQHILPGGSHHEVFKKSLRDIGDFVMSLKDTSGSMVPLIFRPFHEMNGDWFWWGASHCTPEQYKDLYRFTVAYLRDSLQVHQLLYAWSPDRNFQSEAEYLQYYPGDAYVDVLGVDNYGDLAQTNTLALATQKLQIVTSLAKSKKKVAAFTETGLQNLVQPDWYTKNLLPLLKTVKGLAYVMVWSNSSDAYWTPPPGHAAANDFKSFVSDPHILMNPDLINIYRLQKP